MQEEKTIRLCYRKIIDAASVAVWDRYVFDSSYTELLMQAQFYNQEKKYNTFAELLLNVPASEKLHFLVSSSVIGYLQQLNGIIPDVLDNLGRHFMPFKNFRFEIINSDFRKKEIHRVAVNFFSEEMTWHNTIGNQLLVSIPGKQENTGETLTHMLELKPFLAISSLKNRNA
jgi:hypothetical protein